LSAASGNHAQETFGVFRIALTTALLLVVVAAGCSAAPAATSPAPSPTAGAPLTIAELRFRLIEAFGPLWYCDPDFWPIAVQDEAERSIERFGEVQADTEAFVAILAHLAIASGAEFTADQKLAIYRAWKQLNAISLEPTGDGSYRFDYLNMPGPGASEGRRTTGTIDEGGQIAIDVQTPAGEPPCPICLARGTHIATPDGDVAVEDVRVGMRVWSIDGTGQRLIANVVQVGQTRVPATHQVVRLVLDDGRTVTASPGHPLIDGRTLAGIQAGDSVDVATVVSASLEPYDGGSTYDLLTDSPTGAYFAGGIPLGSTLAAD
jgi:Hint domain